MSNELIKDAEESQSIEKTASEQMQNTNPVLEAAGTQVEQVAHATTPEPNTDPVAGSADAAPRIP